MKSIASVIDLKLLILSLGWIGFADAQVISPSEAEKIRHPKGAEVRLFVQKRTHPKAAASMSVLTVPAGGQVPEHRDPEDELVYFLEGEGTMWIDDKAYPIHVGDVAYLPKNSKVKFQAGNHAVKVLQVFAPAGVEKKYQDWKVKKPAKNNP